MIESYLITRDRYDLAERERRSRDFALDPGVAHIRLDTCNRLEYYWGQGRIPLDTARHLYRVASGLESALVGEKAILGQVRQAYLEACGRYRLSGALNRLFQSAIQVGREVRARTSISQGAVSHSQIAAGLLEETGFDFEQRTIAILGINDLTISILRFLRRHRTLNLLLSTRNAAKALDIARRFGGETFPVAERGEQLQRCDCLIAATRAPHYLVQAGELAGRSRPLMIIDLSVPRSIDPGAASLPGITLYNLEDIERRSARSREVRRGEIDRAAAIIERALARLEHWQNHRAAGRA